jgi:hypothetical protein
VTTKGEMRLERRKRALLFAGMIRDGFSLRAIASLQGCSAERVRQVLACGCPDFIQQIAGRPTPKPVPVPALRPTTGEIRVVVISGRCAAPSVGRSGSCSCARRRW